MSSAKCQPFCLGLNVLKGRQCVDGAIVILTVSYFHANLSLWRHDINTICVVTTWNGYRIMVSKMDYPMASYTINHSPLNQRITWQDTYDHMISLHHLAIILLIVHPFYIELPIPLWYSHLKMILENEKKKTLVDICLIKNTKSKKIRIMCYLIFLSFSSTGNAIAARTPCIKYLSVTSCAYRKKKKKENQQLTIAT